MEDVDLYWEIDGRRGIQIAPTITVDSRKVVNTIARCGLDVPDPEHVLVRQRPHWLQRLFRQQGRRTRLPVSCVRTDAVQGLPSYRWFANSIPFTPSLSTVTGSTRWQFGHRWINERQEVQVWSECLTVTSLSIAFVEKDHSFYLAPKLTMKSPQLADATIDLARVGSQTITVGVHAVQDPKVGLDLLLPWATERNSLVGAAERYAADVERYVETTPYAWYDSPSIDVPGRRSTDRVGRLAPLASPESAGLVSDRPSGWDLFLEEREVSMEAGDTREFVVRVNADSPGSALCAIRLTDQEAGRSIISDLIRLRVPRSRSR